MHVSGHANAEELRTVLSLLRPQAVMPVHGEFRMLAAHARLAQQAGVPASGSSWRRTAPWSSWTGAGRGWSTGSRPASPSWTAWGSATSGTWRCGTGGGCPRTAS